MNLRRAHDFGCDVLGASMPYQGTASDYGASYGPLSPDQLAQLDRKLKPDEQAAVDRAQSSAADKQLADVRKGGGPQSATVAVTPGGAVIKSLGTKSDARPWWQWALVAVGVAGVGFGVYQVAVD